MIAKSLIIKRALSTERAKNIGEIFRQENVQNILNDITRYDETKLFTRRPVNRLKTPKLMFMTDEQLEIAKKNAYKKIEARCQMPPVMEPDTSEPEVISRDEEITGYTKFKIMFIDIGPGYTNRNRLMSVRETNGTLRYPTHVERSRLNHMFYPKDYRSIDPPKLFEDENLLKLLKRREYLYVLNRACVQFEPDDPRYVKITTKVYDYIDDIKDYEKLRSTRHFGPMCLYLIYHKKADNLKLAMLSKNFVDDAGKLDELYSICHGSD